MYLADPLSSKNSIETNKAIISMIGSKYIVMLTGESQVGGFCLVIKILLLYIRFFLFLHHDLWGVYQYQQP